MKKVIVILLSLILLASLAACSLGDGVQKIKDYVSENSGSLRSSVEDAIGSIFTERREAIETSIRVEDRGLVFDVTLGDLFNVDEATRTQIQQAVQNREENIRELLDKLESKLPVLKSVTVNLLDADGNQLASVTSTK